MKIRKCPHCPARMKADSENYLCLEFGKTQDLTEFVDVWKCENCFMVMPRRVNKRHKDKPTPSQEKAVVFFTAEFMRIHGRNDSEYEIKESKVELLSGGNVMLTLEGGRKNDTGKLSSLFRDRALVVIGRMGHYSTYIHPKGHEGSVKLTGLHDCMFASVKERELEKKPEGSS